ADREKLGDALQDAQKNQEPKAHASNPFYLITGRRNEDLAGAPAPAPNRDRLCPRRESPAKPKVHLFEPIL
ncbi:MAG TPA: hypothetical protein VGZ01_01390, partial [Trinickia sp.]|nr:hypothetical protein [Trinickia sp.]